MDSFLEGKDHVQNWPEIETQVSSKSLSKTCNMQLWNIKPSESYGTRESGS